MQIKYDNKAIEKVCTNASYAKKKYGERISELIHQRIDEITAAESIEQMVKFGIGRCHPLHNKRKGQYAVDLVHPYRLVFRKIKDDIKIVCVVEIVDYH